MLSIHISLSLTLSLPLPLSLHPQHQLLHPSLQALPLSLPLSRTLLCPKKCTKREWASWGKYSLKVNNYTHIPFVRTFACNVQSGFKTISYCLYSSLISRDSLLINQFSFPITPSSSLLPHLPHYLFLRTPSSFIFLLSFLFCQVLTWTWHWTFYSNNLTLTWQCWRISRRLLRDAVTYCTMLL